MLMDLPIPPPSPREDVTPPQTIYYTPPSDVTRLVFDAPPPRRATKHIRDVFDPYGTPPSSPTRFTHDRGAHSYSPSRSGSGSVSGSPAPTAGERFGSMSDRKGSLGVILGNAGGENAPTPMRKPFNFQPMIAPAGPIGKPAQRRGHRYKHSSVSHQIFLEPPPRAPLSLPASLPIPTFSECLSSITPTQRTRAVWCLTHILVAAFTLWSAGGGSLALTALSHVILFDAFSASVCVAVDVLANFDVWRRSTIRHPFGLERVEVLAGFAMAVFLVFMGLDIMSHTIEHLLEGFQAFHESERGGGASAIADPAPGAHPHVRIGISGGDLARISAHINQVAAASLGEAHDEHTHHARPPPGTIDLTALLAIASTLISALVLRNHARISRTMHLTFLPTWIPPLLTNPAHFLTLAFSTLLLLLPLMTSSDSYARMDRAMALAIATCMVALGGRLLKSLGSMLLMSMDTGTRGRGDGAIGALVREIEEDPSGVVKRVVEAKVWQVHYGLGMASLRVQLAGPGSGGAAGELRVRERIMRIVKDRLGGGGYGRNALKWEVSVAFTAD